MMLKKIILYSFVLCALPLAILTAGCKNNEADKPANVPQSPLPSPLEPGCMPCHPAVTLDKNHSFACTDCHRGDNSASDKESAHKGLVYKPAHPDHMAVSCGGCHSEQIQRYENSLHFTLNNAVNLTRLHFGADNKLDSLLDIPLQHQQGNEKLAVVDDMLRRNCLRCHVYSSGDSYSAVRRATGCGACHLAFSKGKLESHTFTKTPSDKQCLSCHYGNRVGADYYGKYEHDLNWEYRTPYGEEYYSPRPYGVEQHNLSADIHKQRGLFCVDCHSTKGLSDKTARLQCNSCHGWKPGDPKPINKNLTVADDKLMLSSVRGKRHEIPAMVHPAHEQYGKEVSCQVCHAKWSFNDSTTHLLRSEYDDFDQWERLTVQSNSWVEKFLNHNLYSDDDEIPPVAWDGISGEMRSGIWYQGYTERRWERMIIRRDKDGIIKVFRPILDLSISAVDQDGKVIFDNLTGNGDGLLPYTPHTTGPAGMFYLSRFSHLLLAEDRGQKTEDKMQ